MSNMDKTSLRTQLRAARRSLRAEQTAELLAARGQAVAAAVMSDPAVQAAVGAQSTIASYVSFGAEPPTAALHSALAAAGCRVLIPVIERGGIEYPSMAWADAGAGVGAQGARGVPSPLGPILGIGAIGLTDLETRVILVPALAAGRDGTRLGQGGGYYDRMLETLPLSQLGGPIRLALVAPTELFDTVPVEPHDCPVDRAITA